LIIPAIRAGIVPQNGNLEDGFAPPPPDCRYRTKRPSPGFAREFPFRSFLRPRQYWRINGRFLSKNTAWILLRKIQAWEFGFAKLLEFSATQNQSLGEFLRNSLSINSSCAKLLH
jgi:hypothetical protein